MAHNSNGIHILANKIFDVNFAVFGTSCQQHIWCLRDNITNHCHISLQVRQLEIFVPCFLIETPPNFWVDLRGDEVVAVNRPQVSIKFLITQLV